MDIPSDKLSRRVYNLAAISFTPGELYRTISKYIPDTSITYKPDNRQNYADSWPMSLDDSCARRDWGWRHSYDIDQMTKIMIELISKKLNP
jgi:nucleoside-diphosphate-sugar epimerase